MIISIYIQARMGSSRLPGKVLKRVGEKKLLEYQIERLRRVKKANEIIVLTTTDPQDKPIIDLCTELCIPSFQGSEEDVLNRYYEAANYFSIKPDVIIRVTADCPLIDPAIIDQLIELYLKHQPKCDYASNSLIRSFPRGLDCEIFSYKNLLIAHEEAKLPDEREHVTPFFYRHPERFSLKNLMSKTPLQHHRWTVDTEEDFQLIKLILEGLYHITPEFHLHDILDFLKLHPEYMKINQHIIQKKLSDQTEKQMPN